ncbi:MAG: hypothetical protein AAGJ96_07240 [Pseudomonadota bacterium]
MKAGPLLRESLDFTLLHWDKLFGVALTAYLPFLFASLLLGTETSAGTLVTFVGFQIVSASIHLVIWRMLRGQAFNPAGDVQSAAARVLPLTALGVLVSLLVMLGLFALIVPGIYLMGALLMVTPVYLFEGNALRAPARSWDLTESHRWELFSAISVATLLILTGTYLAYRFANTLGVASSVGLLLDTAFSMIVLVFAAVFTMRVYTQLAPQNPPMR